MVDKTRLTRKGPYLRRTVMKVVQTHYSVKLTTQTKTYRFRELTQLSHRAVPVPC